MISHVIHEGSPPGDPGSYHNEGVIDPGIGIYDDTGIDRMDLGHGYTRMIRLGMDAIF